jgi:hypothetical protein
LQRSKTRFLKHFSPASFHIYRKESVFRHLDGVKSSESIGSEKDGEVDEMLLESDLDEKEGGSSESGTEILRFPKRQHETRRLQLKITFSDTIQCLS